MVTMGEHQRVRESRMLLRVATADEFVTTVEAITGRTVRAFAGAVDPEQGIVFEDFLFEPHQRRDGESPSTGPRETG